MKRQFLLLAGSVLILASCTGNTDQRAIIQAQIDSTVNAKAAQHDAENAAKNDSTLKAMEKEKADAMGREAQNDNKKQAAVKNTEAKPALTPTVAPAPPVNAKGAQNGTNAK